MDEFTQTPGTLELELCDIDVNSFIMDERTLVKHTNPHKFRVDSFYPGSTRVIRGLLINYYFSVPKRLDLDMFMPVLILSAFSPFAMQWMSLSISLDRHHEAYSPMLGRCTCMNTFLQRADVAVVC